MYYILDLENNKITGSFHSFANAKTFMDERNIVDEKHIVVEDLKMNYVSRITYVNGECVYNNTEYWRNAMPLSEESTDEIIDILGQPVSVNRYNIELIENKNRIGQIDGRPGQIMYNMTVGQEFVALFREECILTDFTNNANTSPMIIFEKLSTVIAMLNAGEFRVAKMYLQGYREKIKDDFLTDERLDKYIAMLDAADAIDYATDEEYFYRVPATELPTETTDEV